MNKAGVCLAALLVLSAQTPTPAPLPSGPPLRHMEYKFTVDYQNLGEGHVSGIGTGGSGVVSEAGTGGRQGKIDVDVLAAANDGGLLVSSNEWLENQPTHTQTFVCAVYPDGRVICPDNLPVTDAETTLLSYLGRKFFDPTLVDDKGHWQRSFGNKNVQVLSDYDIVGSADANPLVVNLHSEVKSLAGVGRNLHDEAHFVYDPALSVPLSIHDVVKQTARGSMETFTTMDFTLTKDSFAKT